MFKKFRVKKINFKGGVDKINRTGFSKITFDKVDVIKINLKNK